MRICSTSLREKVFMEKALLASTSSATIDKLSNHSNRSGKDKRKNENSFQKPEYSSIQQKKIWNKQKQLQIKFGIRA